MVVSCWKERDETDFLKFFRNFEEMSSQGFPTQRDDRYKADEITVVSCNWADKERKESSWRGIILESVEVSSAVVNSLRSINLKRRKNMNVKFA